MARRLLVKADAHSIELADEVAQFTDDPLGFVLFIFPWGEKGTSLEDEDGPDIWQVMLLDRIGQEVRKDKSVNEAIQIAVASGNGIGKTTLIAWIILWFMSVRHHPQVIVTANTLGQLKGKTWRELSKWHKIAINRDWFQWTATQFYLKEHPSTWVAKAEPWSKERKEAFQGAHEKNILIVFDEGSAIDDEIWEAADGSMTTPGAMWVVFGNPTRNQGRFRECFRQFRHRWITHQIDSRNAKVANQKHIKAWIEDHGEDSDFVRVRVRGEFPRADMDQFIPQDVVEAAQQRYRKLLNWHNGQGYNHDFLEIHAPAEQPLIMSLDVARKGVDQCVVGLRRGRIFRILAKWRELDTPQIVNRFASLIDEYSPDAIFVDGNGPGAGVFDMLIHRNYPVEDVVSSMKAENSRGLSNKRTEMWFDTLQWLKGGGIIPDDKELRDDLVTPLFSYNRTDQIQLETKEEMRSRGMPSPDAGDALAMTFYSRVAPRETAYERMKRRERKSRAQEVSWMAY